ncbi:uncharacterized protein ACLA_046760 [Aspergillus clavatus NRRL 1]|uniref:60S ribosomal protein L36 n=1 Tax=Aspergillus clavatus (strain ATCC 1007 / CBS 513.65 / DSM 816 / NCTC 3887 / NRRL 1 / QM 1276 / 107) TaxID=344612 RepID=A1CH55_ASPCL|nr:ribosomal protein L36e, putative [Aspergillus clavatus NRRL 1]EAW10210.1 ribosomal protein L36e, putative [Aspergillus clavatus NRRL 1]
MAARRYSIQTMATSEVMRGPPGETPTFAYRDSVRYWNIVTQTTCLTISTICVWMRIYAKFLITRAPGWEDSYAIITFETDKYGSGAHIWEVEESDLRQFSKLANTSQIVYGPLIFITKLSILLLYLRVFAPAFKSRTYFCIHALIWLNLGFYLPDTVVKVFECSPRSRIWDKRIEGRCLNINIPFIVTSAINVVSDFLILILPIVSVWHLQMRSSKKWGTSAIFAAGVFACMCSVMRLVVSVQNKAVKDKTYDWFPEFLWTHFFRRAKTLISSTSTDYSSRSGKKAIEIINRPLSRTLRQQKKSSGTLSVSELCDSGNWEMEDVEQRPNGHAGHIYSGMSYTTAEAQGGRGDVGGGTSDGDVIEPPSIVRLKFLACSIRQARSGRLHRDSIRTDDHRLDNFFFSNHRRRQPPVETVVMAQERSGIVVGLNKGHKTTALDTPKTRISRTKGQSSRRTAFVRDIAREVVGLAPYERRIIELLRNTQDKRARKLAKKRLGTFTRGKRKVEDMQRVIAESRRVAGH